MPIKIFSRNKSKKPTTPETKNYLNDDYCQNFLLSNEELKTYITDFSPINRDEWLATNTLAIYKHLINLNGSLYKVCTEEACPVMSAGIASYYWFDDKNKKSKISAPEYINMALINLEKFITTEENVPTKYDSSFPANFKLSLLKYYKLMAHIFCHLYISHFEEFIKMDLNSHLNTVFYHYLIISENHTLIDVKELEPLEDLIKKWIPTFFNLNPALVI